MLWEGFHKDNIVMDPNTGQCSLRCHKPLPHLWCVQARYGKATGGIVLLVIPAIAMLNCMVVSLSTNAR